MRVDDLCTGNSVKSGQSRISLVTFLAFTALQKQNSLNHVKLTSMRHTQQRQFLPSVQLIINSYSNAGNHALWRIYSLAVITNEGPGGHSISVLSPHKSYCGFEFNSGCLFKPTLLIRQTGRMSSGRVTRNSVAPANNSSKETIN